MEVKLKESQYGKGLVVGNFRDGVDYGRRWVNMVVAQWSRHLRWPWRLVGLSSAFEWIKKRFSPVLVVKWRRWRSDWRREWERLVLGRKRDGRWGVLCTEIDNWFFCVKKEIGNLSGLCKCQRSGKPIWERPSILSLLSYQCSRVCKGKKRQKISNSRSLKDESQFTESGKS